MKKNVLYIICLLFVFFSCRFQRNAEKIVCNNLFLVYMAGDNSLNKAIYSDIEEIKKGIEKEGDIILVLADRNTNDYYSDGWNEARLLEFVIKNGEVIETELEDERLELTIEWLDDTIDSGNADNLENFLKFANCRYDYNHAYLDIWNHGGGWKSGDKYPGNSRNICYDESTNNSISLCELSDSLLNSNIHFDVIIMDACNMGSIEVACSVQETTDTLIFSQAEIPEDGFPYDFTIPILFSNAKIEKKCEEICKVYSESYELHQTTISSVKIDLNNSLNDFLQKLDSFFFEYEDYQGLYYERYYLYEFQENVVDLSVFNNDLRIEEELKKFIISNYSNISTGCSIYFPQYYDYSQDSWEYTNEKISFLKKCPNYYLFLNRYEHFTDLLPNNDTYEPNNHIEDSYRIVLEQGNIISSKLWCSEDVDFYLLKGRKVINSISLKEPSNNDYNFIIYLYKDSKFVKRLDDVNNVIEIVNEDYDEIYIKVYSTFGFFNQTEEYYLEFK